MENWTIDEVGIWLKNNGFELMIKPFKRRNIDGRGLLNLTENMIEQMISGRTYDAEQDKLVIDRFKTKLNELKMQENANVIKRIPRPNSASRATVDASQSMTDTNTAYERILTITPDHPRVNMRFFHNPLFCETMKSYLAKRFRTTFSIQFKQQELSINLAGHKNNVKDGLDAMKSLFQSTETKIYNAETTCQKAVYWSQHIFSSSAIEVIQQIMNNERVFTIWEKTAMFSGFYKVSYFNHDLFGASPENIVHILNHEIDFIENIPMPNEKTKNFMKEIQKFVTENKQDELAIIQYKYPSTSDLKINLFGRKKLAKMVKKKLQLLINKHTLKKLEIKMTPLQHEHLVDNCFQQLKDLERKYSDDSVIIRIRQKEFYAPQYLTDDIKRQINSFVCQSAVFVIRKIGENSFLTNEDNIQLTQIVKKYGCRIENIDSRIHLQTIQVPKALIKSSISSNALIEQSNQFSTSLSIRLLSLSNSSIEIHRANRLAYLAVSNVTVVSTDAGAAEEHISSADDNRFFGTKSGRKLLFKRWTLPSSSDIEKQQVKQKRSIIKFIEGVFEVITNHCPNVTTISFSTNGWQNFSIGEQFIEDLLIQTKQAMETKRSTWRILFLFDDEQSDLYQKFNETIKRLRSNADDFAQYTCSCREIEITVTTSKEYDLSMCEYEINKYIQKHLSTSEILANAADLVKWDQHMINAFHKYCLDRTVIINMDLTTKQLRLTGAIEDVTKTIEKYRLLCKILNLKSSIPTEISSNNRAYNIAFSYCQQDQSVCHDLLALLYGEGYQICQASSNVSISKSCIDRSDLLLVYFSETYSRDTHCMADVNYAKSSGKFILPIAEIKDNSWLQSMTIAGLFYDLFNHEIELEFTGDFNLDYDKIFSVLLQYTKPGVTGQQYEQIAPKTQVDNPIDTEYEEPAFGYVSSALQKLTKTQRKEKEKVYQSQLKKRIKSERIKDDELNNLVGTLTLVVDDLEATLSGEIIDDSINSHLQKADSYELKDLTRSVNDFLMCIKRWLERAPNVIQKNITPFTPTGDINDASFLLYSETASFDWLIENQTDWNGIPAENGYFHFADWNCGSWFTAQQADGCLLQKIRADGRINLIYTTIEENEIVWNKNSHIDATNDSNTLGNEVKSPEEMRKLKQLDDLNDLSIAKKRMRYHMSHHKYLWRGSEQPEIFFKQKIQNAIEFQKLCGTYN